MYVLKKCPISNTKCKISKVLLRLHDMPPFLGFPFQTLEILKNSIFRNRYISHDVHGQCYAHFMIRLS